MDLILNGRERVINYKLTCGSLSLWTVLYPLCQEDLFLFKEHRVLTEVKKPIHYLHIYKVYGEMLKHGLKFDEHSPKWKD